MGTNKTQLKLVFLVREKSYRTKEKIVDAAMSLIAQKGYTATSMRQIAKKAGLTTGSIYNYFESKTHVLLEIQTKFLDDLTKSIERDDRGVFLKKEIENIIESILKAINNNKLAYKIMVDEFYHFPKPQQRILNIKAKKLEDLIQNVFAEGAKSGELKVAKNVKNEDCYKMLTFFILGACNYATRWLDPKGSLSYKEISSLFSSFVLNGVLENKYDVAPIPKTTVEEKQS